MQLAPDTPPADWLCWVDPVVTIAAFAWLGPSVPACADGQASITKGMIIGRRRKARCDHRPTSRVSMCSS